MRQGSRYNPKQPFYRKNEQIRAQTVRLIGEDGKQINVMARDQALGLAREQEKDLVEVAPLASPPVVKLIEFSKFLYQLKKKKRAEKKSSKTSETKQIRMTPFIGDHDLEIKLKRAREFIEDGDKVKFGVRFPRRLMGRQDLGRVLLGKVASKLEDIAKVEREIHEEGRQLAMVISKLK